MTDTLTGVTERVRRLRARIDGSHPGACDEALTSLVSEAEELLQAFERTEAVHVSLGLTDDGFAFSLAQEELGRERRSFSGDVERLRARMPRRAQGRAELERRLLRVEALARRAPLTTSRDLEMIRTGRVARQLAAV